MGWFDEWETAEACERRRSRDRGMVVAMRSGTIIVDGVREKITAGVTRIWRRHEWMRNAEVAGLFDPESEADPAATWFLPAATTGE